MYDYTYAMDDEFGAIFAGVYLICWLFSMGISIASYVLSSLGLYTIAKRRGIGSPWLAWIPGAHFWIVGSISDQYRYVTKGQIKSKRKVLIGLWIGMIAIVIAMVASMVMAMVEVNELLMALVALVSALLLIVGAVVFHVFYYMAMYDLYTSVNPPNNVMFLVLSIFFRITEPFFIFFNRKKDGGMPPRCDISAAPVQAAPQYLPPKTSVQEPWENVNEE